MLPPALLDLTLTRLSHRAGAAGSDALCTQPWPRRPSSSGVRMMQQAALASAPQSVYHPPPQKQKTTSRPSRTRPAQGGSDLAQLRLALEGRRPEPNAISAPMTVAQELAKRVEKLTEVATNLEAAVAPPVFTEEQLMAFYQDVMTEPVSGPLRQHSDATDMDDQLAQAAVIVDTAYHRLQQQLAVSQSAYEPSPFLQALRARHAALQDESETVDISTHVQPHRTLLAQVEALLTRVEPRQQKVSIPVLIMTLPEWEALVRLSVYSDDLDGAEKAINLMKRTGVPVTETVVNDLLKPYADNANVLETERILNSYVAGPVSDRQQHLHVRAHLRATPHNTIPESAMTVLHTYEAQSNLPAMSTYTSVVTTLLSVRDSMANAQAWDLYSHMRYVGHAVPDVFLYTTMIRACASPSFTVRASEPERALDLWTEMTVDHKIPPTVATYNAVILACVRSGSKTYINEGFRLAKQMLESHKDANGVSTFRPDQRTFCALLEGAKRIGDLNRTRWILSKIAQVMAENRTPDTSINEEVLMHAFHTYTSYNPPFKRNLAPLQKESNEKTADVSSSPPPAQSSAATETKAHTPRLQYVSLAHIAPQSRSEVISEAEGLFSRALAEGAVRKQDGFDPKLSFGNVEMSTRLVNSYMSVHYKHGGINAARQLFGKVFEQAGVERSARSFKEALERCLLGPTHERQDALRFGRDLFRGFLKLESSGKAEIDARIIEGVHVAFIRLLCLTKNEYDAEVLVKKFVAKYPPANVRQPDMHPVMRSTKTMLFAAKPLVRMTSKAEVPDSKVPPMLTFRDLSVLHHRFKHIGDGDGIAYVKYVCKAYEWALRVRRDQAFHAKPVGNATIDGQEVVQDEEDEDYEDEDEERVSNRFI